jgi:hypothetical protein
VTEPMSDERLAEIRRREGAASPGPWEDFEGDIEGVCHITPHGNVNTMARTGQAYSHADGAFIAHARADIPELLAEVLRLRAALEHAERVAADRLAEDEKYLAGWKDARDHAVKIVRSLIPKDKNIAQLSFSYLRLDIAADKLSEMQP